ncbi:MAG: hypothetical protein IMY67_12205 [Bacteroidetes bacterium]|nr:hypothetical protein [Bacteroidota bacterium]
MTDKDILEIKRLLQEVAHVGVDFGYGAFSLNNTHAERARDILDKIHRAEAIKKKHSEIFGDGVGSVEFLLNLN